MSPLGKFVARFEVDTVSADVEFLVVADLYLKVPILIGHTFTEKPNIMIYKTNKHLIFVEVPNINMDNDKFKLHAIKDQIIEPRSTIPVDVVVIGYSGCLYVQYSHRNISNNDYFILPGIYNFINGEGYIMICNNSYNVLQINENDVITRAHTFLEKQNDYVNLINKIKLILVGNYQKNIKISCILC